MTTNTKPSRLTLVTGGTGKVGRRVAERLTLWGGRLRIGSRSSVPSFNWDDESTWPAALEGVSSIFISYAPDIAIPGATGRIERFVRSAVERGAQHLVLLSGRGETEAQAAERIVQGAGIDWTIVRASWFMQNFSEGEFLPMVREGVITLPAKDIQEPFVDVNDIADVVVAALTGAGHAGQVYEVTGPAALTFTELSREISRASGREIQFVRVPQDAFVEGLGQAGTPTDVAWLLKYLFAEVLDGRNTHVVDGVQRALGREPASFEAFAARIAARGLWSGSAEETAA